MASYIAPCLTGEDEPIFADNVERFQAEVHKNQALLRKRCSSPLLVELAGRYEVLRRTATCANDLTAWLLAEGDNIAEAMLTLRGKAYKGATPRFRDIHAVAVDDSPFPLCDQPFSIVTLQVDCKENMHPAPLFSYLGGDPVEQKPSKNPRFNREYDLLLFANDWAFVGARILAELNYRNNPSTPPRMVHDRSNLATTSAFLDGGQAERDRITTAILTKHFPAVSLETYHQLAESGLLPEDPDALAQWLMRSGSTPTTGVDAARLPETIALP